MDAPAAAAAAPVDPAAAAAPAAARERAVRCLRCGYDLRGTDAGGRCPECGLKAHWSLRAPEQLSQYPADWVAAMAWAVRLLAIAYGAGFAAMILGITDIVPMEAAGPWLLLGVAVVHAIGAWRLARRSGHWTEPPMGFNRLLLRTTPWFSVAAAAGALWLPWHYDQTLAYFTVGALFAGMIAPVAIFLRLRAVARMIADKGLAEHSAIVCWGFLLTAAALGAFSYWQAHAEHRTVDNAFAFIAMAIICLGMLLFSLWGAGILAACVVDFGRAAKVATAAWKADAPPV